MRVSCVLPLLGIERVGRKEGRKECLMTVERINENEKIVEAPVEITFERIVLRT